MRWVQLFFSCTVGAVLSFGAAQVAPARYLISGVVKGEQVQLELTLTLAKVSGNLLGTPPQPLQGGRTRDGRVQLRGAGVNLMGHLPERFSKSRTFSGTLADGTPFSWALAASYTVRRTDQGPFLHTRTETPFWLIAPWRRLNRRLERFTEIPAASFVRDAQQTFANTVASSDFFYPYSYESSLAPTLWTSDTLSLLETSFYDTGGAHPNTAYRSLTFYKTGGRVVQLELQGLFTEGARYRPLLLGEINRKLHARHAAWLEDGSVKLTERDLSVFNLTDRGLEFTFAPYAVGPYAQGKFAVTVPYAKLAGLLKPGLRR